jgi:hypothetical protein
MQVERHQQPLPPEVVVVAVALVEMEMQQIGAVVQVALVQPVP